MINSKTMCQRLLTSILSIFIAMMFSFSAQAASCKGKSESSCSAASDCSWVSAYKRKDGVKVSGHCRTKAGETSTKKSTTKTDKQSSKETKSKDKKVKKDKKSKNKEDKDKKAKKDKTSRTEETSKK